MTSPLWARRPASHLIAVTLLVAGCGVVVPQPRAGSARAGPTPTASTSATATPTAPAEPATIQEFVPQAEAFVEAHRGLRFTAPVPVTLLDDAAFQQKLLGRPRQQDDKAELEKAAKELRALGLVDGSVDLGKLTDSLLGAAVVGFYDDQAKALYVRGGQVTPHVRVTLVHELTHALQDQHFGLDRPALRQAEDERSEAFTALVEGDAVRIQDEYHQTLSAQERDDADREDAGSGPPPGIPEVLLELLAFPYIFGPPFTEAVIASGGQQALDDAFSTPPTTTAEVIHPGRFLQHRAVQSVTAPPADGTAFDHGVFGEWGLDLLFQEAITAGTLSSSDAHNASAHWDGDSYVAWDSSAKSCLRDRIAADGASGADELAAALRHWAETRSDVTITGTNPLTVTSCG